MFEEVCLVCGKHVNDDGRAYCSDDCENLDLASPSISSASSALSSPHTGYALGGDVPALPPSTLGAALEKSRYRYSASSSSTSLISLSLVGPIDENESRPIITGEHSPSEYGFDATSKLANYNYLQNPQLFYVRQPSGINNRSMAPHLHKRTPSIGSFPQAIRSVAKSAPHSSSSSNADDSSPDSLFHEGEQADRDSTPSESELDLTQGNPKSKRHRNRTSLPAYFSLLQISSSTEDRRLPHTSSSGHTIARVSPPTPTLAPAGLAMNTNIAFHAETRSINLDTSKIRGRAARESRPRQHSGRSSSSSRSHSRPSNQWNESQFCFPTDDSNTARDWTIGRNMTVHRDASPSSKQWFGEETARVPMPKRSHSSGHPRATSVKPRGRLRAEDLDGVGLKQGAPGYGQGRSGLLDREHSTQNAHRIHYV